MRIDYSQLQCFITCPRQYQLKMIDCLRKIKYDERDVDLSFGHCIHSALEVLYKEKSIDKAKECFKAEFQGLEGQKVKTPANGLILLDRYYNYYQQPNNDLSDTNLETISVEEIIEVDLDGVIFFTKLDRVVKSKAGIFDLEHKTTTKLGNTYFYQFDPNMQISGHSYCILKKYGQCSGSIINALVMGHRENKYKGEPAGFHCRFIRDIVNRNKEQLEDFKDNVKKWCARLKNAKFYNEFPKNESACHQYKGCAFKELCGSCGDEQIRDSLYEKYDPLEYLK